MMILRLRFLNIFIITTSLCVSQQVFSQIKYNDDLKKSDMNTEEAMEYHFNKLIEDPYIKNHLKWKLFFAQHPMYLLVDEDRGDPPVGERIPPWGARSKEELMFRILI